MRAARLAPLATPAANHGSIDDGSCCAETVLGERLQVLQQNVNCLLEEYNQNGSWKEAAGSAVERRVIDRQRRLNEFIYRIFLSSHLVMHIYFILSYFSQFLIILAYFAIGCFRLFCDRLLLAILP